MGVDSVYEMYTFMWAWQQYAIVWGILKSTGLAFLPFLGLLIRVIIDVLESQMPGQAAVTSLSQIEVNFIMMLLLIVVAVEPSVNISLEKMEFEKICFAEDIGNVKFKPQNSGSTDQHKTMLDKISMKGFEEVKIPPWWFAVLSVSSGVVKSGQAMMPCVADVRLTAHRELNYIIDDQILSDEIKIFSNFCYLPALTKFLNDSKSQEGKLPKNSDSARKKIIDKFNVLALGTDTSWIGSRILAAPELDYYTTIEVKNSNFAGSEKIKSRNSKESHLFCDEVWNLNLRIRMGNYLLSKATEFHFFGGNNNVLFNEDGSLRDSGAASLFVNSLGFETSSRVKESIELALKLGLIESAEELRNRKLDYALRSKLNRSYLRATSNFGSPGFTETAKDAALLLGTSVSSFFQYASLYSVVSVLYPYGAILIMLLIIFLPLGFVFSSYSYGFLMMASLGIFGVKFYFYLWHLAWWMDQNLLNVFLADIVLAGSSVRADIVDLIAATMYFVFPLIWTLVLGWAGLQLGNMMSSAGDAQNITHRTIDDAVRTAWGYGKQSRGAIKKSYQNVFGWLSRITDRGDQQGKLSTMLHNMSGRGEKWEKSITARAENVIRLQKDIVKMGELKNKLELKSRNIP